MSSNSPGNDRLLASILRPIARPQHYRKQFRIAGIFVVAAAFIYFFFGLLPLAGLVVIGGFVTRYALKRNIVRKSLGR